jgi:prepilin-type N-terminal cleavage/methylation domain-containing protein
MPRATRIHGIGSPLGSPAEGLHHDSGHTLIELLVTLLVIAIAVALPAASLTRTLAHVEAAAAARLWEGGAAAAQLQAIWGGSPRDVVISSYGLEVAGEGVGRTAIPPLGTRAVPLVNVARWEQGDAVSVRFLPGFGSPDGAGSLYFGCQGSGRRVVLRLESGLTKGTQW